MSSSQGRRRAFPLPSEIGPVQGAEDWAEMYPYFTHFRPEDDERFWFYNSMHFPEPMPAFDMISAEVAYQALGAVTARVFTFPGALGIDHRIVNGRIYITSNTVTDPAEIEKRLAHFEKRAGHYYRNWDKLYGEWKDRQLALLREVESIEVPALGPFEDEATVLEARGIAQNHYLRKAYHHTVDCYSRMWHHHFGFLMLGYGAYLVFFQFCKKAFPEIPDQTVARMVAGIDVIMFRPDDELKKLARLAIELKLDDLFTEGANPEEVLAAVAGKGEKGRKWLAAFEAVRQPWFNITTGDGLYHHHRSWNDDLTVPFAALPRYMAQIRAGESIDRPTDRLQQERARIIAEYRALLPTDNERAAFDQMLGLCHQVFPFVEDHKFYCDHWFITLFYNKIREFGRLLVAKGVLDDAEDIFQLHHTEVDLALGEVMVSWAAGTPSVSGQHWKPVVARRKQILKALSGWAPPPALGPLPGRIEDPAVQMLWGITSERLEEWSEAADADSIKVIKGLAASQGVAEGVARVLLTVDEIGELRDGEILVCPITSPSWGPVFSKIKAAVSDIGGTMSHAAIVAREYGLPAVVGTGVATKRIRTGMRIRVDGDKGEVTILEEED